MNLKNLEQKLNHTMVQSKLYLTEELSLNHLAMEVAVTPHQLSQFINEHLKMNFNTFVNSFRIEEAKRILRTQKDNVIMNIAFEVGFSSKSVFNRAFLKMTGRTPQEYRSEK